MKKISLLVCAVFASVTLFASAAVQNKAVKADFTISKADVVPQAELATEKKVGSFNLGKLRKATKGMETDSLWGVYQVLNQFVTGSLEEGFMYTDGQYIYFNSPKIVTPFAKRVPFINVYNGLPMTPVWEVPGASTVTGQQYVFVDAGEYGEKYALPTLTYDPKTLPTSDTTQYYFESYTFGKRFYEGKKAENNLLMAPEYESVTQAGYYTEYPTVVNSNFYDGWGWLWRTGRFSATEAYYLYGTKVRNPWFTDSLVYFDSIVSFIENPTTMYIEHITVDIWTNSDTDTFFPDSANDIITMTILPLLNDSTPDWDNPIATSTAGKAEFLPSAQTWWGSLDFKFYEEDPIAHTKKQVPLIMDSAFVVVLSGLSKNTTDVGFLSDYYDDAPNAADRTFFVDYSEGERDLVSLWKSPANLLINFHSLWPSIQGLTKEVNVPLSGGTLTVTLPTNVWAEDMEIDSDDWIEIEVESEVENPGTEDEEFLYAVDATITIDATDAPRQGEIEIDALGKIYTITVNQGTTPTSIESVKKINDNKLYNVLGIEVDENYKGVVIRNGEKFLQ